MIFAYFNCENAFAEKFYVKNERIWTMVSTFLGLLAKNPTFHFNMLALAISNRNVRFDIVGGMDHTIAKEDLLFFTGFESIDTNIIYSTGDTERNAAVAYYKNMSNLDVLLNVLWNSVLPCYQSQVKEKIMYSAFDFVSQKPQLYFVQKCRWKGIEIPCAAIFTKSVTSQGICCSFNKPLADDIYLTTKYSKFHTGIWKEMNLMHSQASTWDYK